MLRVTTIRGPKGSTLRESLEHVACHRLLGMRCSSMRAQDWRTYATVQGVAVGNGTAFGSGSSDAAGSRR
eukprot:2264284-Prymnesium_polylepis.1